MPTDLSSTASLGDDMKAGRLIAEAAFDPAQLNAIKKAFDDAWEQIAPYVSSRAETVEAGRLSWLASFSVSPNVASWTPSNSRMKRSD